MNGSLKPVLARLGQGERLSAAEAEAAFGIVMDGLATPGQIGGMLMAMRARGESVEELTGAVTAMRARMTRIEAPENAMDVCGTGGDGAASLNISTAVTFVLAACGVPVAKHGNKALSSRAGGADVLAALGVDIEPPIERLSAILAEVGCVFLFAPRHHPALRHAAAVRVELGTRTIMNLTGPMANPAGVMRQLMGVYDPAWVRPVADTLAKLGAKAAWVVHGGGLDELVLEGENQVAALRHGEIAEFKVTAADAGLQPVPMRALQGGDAAENAAALLAVLDGARNGYRDTILFNAAAALIVAGVVTTLPQGVEHAAAALDSGAARGVLDRLRTVSRELSLA
ncbi:anthranilate phosphoribosyltransferase [Acidocella sp.]|uniref:anthranilate phosphoribosyltransferase n=1 Tax=Acidocella sp. TaxID=50710 RepID=UPI00261F4585|nr:anthranilate phosphoribosyltransferase [Acidocella sp.]